MLMQGLFLAYHLETAFHLLGDSFLDELPENPEGGASEESDRSRLRDCLAQRVDIERLYRGSLVFGPALRLLNALSVPVSESFDPELAMLSLHDLSVHSKLAFAPAIELLVVMNV